MAGKILGGKKARCSHEFEFQRVRHVREILPQLLAKYDLHEARNNYGEPFDSRPWTLKHYVSTSARVHSPSMQRHI